MVDAVVDAWSSDRCVSGNPLESFPILLVFFQALPHPTSTLLFLFGMLYFPGGHPNWRFVPFPLQSLVMQDVVHIAYASLCALRVNDFSICINVAGENQK